MSDAQRRAGAVVLAGSAGGGEGATEVGPLVKPALGAPFDPEPGRERVRGWLAFTLVAAVLALALGLPVGVVLGGLDLATAKELATVALTPLLGLASAAVGFYFAGGGRGR